MFYILSPLHSGLLPVVGLSLMCKEIYNCSCVVDVCKIMFSFISEVNLLRVMHSMHASYSELVSFVTYLAPASIVPCVIPASLGDTSILDLHSRYSN